MAWDKTSLETQYTNGTLVAVILDHGVDDEDGAELLQECIDLHNSARGDILNLIDCPSFDDLSGHEFFVAQRFICRLIPSLEGVSAERMMRYVAKLVAKGGNDLLANQPNSAFRAWCEVDSKRAEAVIEAARSDETLAIDHLTFALEATKDLQIARQIALEFDGQRRLSALTALSRIPHQDVHARADTVLTLSSLLDAEPDDALKAHVLAAAVYPFDGAREELTPAALALVSKALSDPGEGTVRVAAQLLFRAKECCSRAVSTLLLGALRWVKPGSRGTLEEIDVGLSHLLKVGQGDLVVEYLTDVLTKDSDALAMKPFDSLARELAKAHLTLVSNTIVAWLATGKRELCQGAEELISEGRLENTPLEPALTSETIADREVYFTCRKAVGYLFTHPVVAASILVSKLRPANATLAQMIKDLLFDPLIVNFGGSVRDYLAKIPETDPAFPHTTELLARAEAYLSGLSTIGVVKELHPSEHRRQLERIRQADFNREVMKKAEKLSVFHDLVHRSVLLHGSHSVTYVQDADGSRRPVEMKLQRPYDDDRVASHGNDRSSGAGFNVARVSRRAGQTMKLILREYLSSLREREELDAILPDLLSELGYAVYSRPQRGTTQHGVDVAAISPDNFQERKVYLFSIKRGDLTRQDWDGTPQALRSSLNEILDVYIPTRVPIEHRGLRIVVCVCLGGDVQEQVRANLEGFIKANTTDTIAFEEWNGDKLASLLLEGVLREDLLPKPLRSHFQKAVALLDEPDVSYRHFSRLAAQLRTNAAANARSRVRAARQLYVCLWILYVWGRDIDNIEAPYLASELCILNAWELLRPMIGTKNSDQLALARVLDQLIRLHLIIADQFVARRIAPGARARDALAMAVNSRTSVDVNIKLFEIIGRIGMTGLWVIWLSEQQQGERTDAITSSLGQFFEIGMSIVENNGALRLPVSDDQTTDIALFGLLCLYGAPDARRLTSWLATMVERYDLSIRSRGKYLTSFSEYADLVAHPRQRSDEYFKEATAGSTLVPFLASWATGLGRHDLVTRLATLTSDKLQHCTMQLWTPGEDSEEHIYINSDIHGRAICDLPILDEGKDLLETIADACTDERGFQSLSAAQTAMWPIILLACRHWRLPVPPNFYIESLRTFFAQNNDAGRGDEPSQPPDGLREAKE